MSNLIGQSLGRYHILEQLGEGGMATVYKAYDTRLETEVAVKVIRTEELSPKVLGRALKRFEREAKAVAKLNHLNIVKVIDYGEYEGAPYLVMPYLSGGTLKHKLTGKPIPWQEATKILLPIARALDYAHRQGIMHRDVKPSNILITEDGDPLLTDFGVAKIIDEEATMDLTGTSATVGTPEYMAPEQVISKSVDHRADIYSLGVVFYEMVSGRKLYTADTPMAVLFKHANEPLPHPTQFIHDLPEQVERLMLITLAKKPEERYQTMTELANALENLFNTKPMPSSQQSGRPSQHAPYTRVTVGQSEDAKQKGKSASTRFPGYWPIGLLGIVIIVGVAIMFMVLYPSKSRNPLSTELPLLTAAPIETKNPPLDVGDTWTRPSDGMTMMYVPEGEFIMGSNDGGINERPPHTVYLNAFWIDKTEVTNTMYQFCVRSGTCDQPEILQSATHTSYYGNSEYDNYPVVYVDWNDANAYCKWAEAHLPTESQWEKAARGTDGRTYPWGEEVDCNKANYNSSCIGDALAVGSYPNGASPYGALNMAGNVWEWVADWYNAGYYLKSPPANPSGPDSGQYKVLRGGSWDYIAGDVSSTNRFRYSPDQSSHHFGFRCAKDATP